MKKNVKVTIASAAAILVVTAGVGGYIANKNGAFFNPSDYNTERDVNHNKAEITDENKKTDEKNDDESDDEKQVKIDENINRENRAQQNQKFGNRDNIVNRVKGMSSGSGTKPVGGTGLSTANGNENVELPSTAPLDNSNGATSKDGRNGKGKKEDKKATQTTEASKVESTTSATRTVTDVTTETTTVVKSEKRTSAVSETVSETTTEEDFHVFEGVSYYSGGSTQTEVDTDGSEVEYSGATQVVADYQPSITVENILNPKNIPEFGLDTESGGSSGSTKKEVKFFVIDNSLGYIENNIYSGQAIDDWDVFCSMFVYFIVDDEIYRFTDINSELLYFGDYPQNPTESFDVVVYARPNKNSEWYSETVTIDVADYKLQIVDFDNNTLTSSEDEWVAYINPTDGNNKVDILKYLKYCFVDTTEQLDKLFVGWTTDPKGRSEAYITEYTFTQKGKTVLYPLPYTEFDSEKYIAYNQLCWNRFEYLQTLTDYKGTDGIIDVPNGINCVDVDMEFDVMKIPSTVFDIHILGFDYACNEAYEVDERNNFYSSENGILYNKDKTMLEDVPINKTEVEVPSSVTNVSLSFSNKIEKMIFTSPIPPAIDLSVLSGAQLVVPGEYYKDYFIAWSSKLGDNTLVADGEITENLYEENGCIYSSDKSEIYVLPSGSKNYYEIADGVKSIITNVFAEKNTAYLVKLPESIEKLGEGVFDTTSIKKVVFTGDVPPEITNTTFGSDVTVYVPKNARESYIEKWSDILGEERCEEIISENEAEIKSDNLGSVVMCEQDHCELVEISDTIDNVDENYNELAGVVVNEIAPYAFANNGNIKYVILPETVKTIDDYAFGNCSALEIFLSTSKDEITIGSAIFDGSHSVKTIVFNAMKANMAASSYSSAKYYSPKNAEGYDWLYEDTCFDYYTVKANGGIFVYGENPPDENADYPIGRYLLGATTNISGEIVLEDSTISIYDAALKNCKNTFWFDESTTGNIDYYGEYAFANSGLSGELNFSDKLEEIGECAFYNCQNITKVTIPKNVYKIAMGAFSNCGSITKVDINSNVLTEIDEYVFDECHSLESVVFGENSVVEKIYDSAFSNTALRELVLPDTVTELCNGFVDYDADFERLEFTSEIPPTLTENRYWLGFGEDYNFGEGISDNFKIIVPNGCEDNYINAWRTQLVINKSYYTREDVLRCENIVRRYLGMDEITEDELVYEEIEQTTEQTTEETTDDWPDWDDIMWDDFSADEETNDNKETVTDSEDDKSNDTDNKEENVVTEEAESVETKESVEEITEEATEATTEEIIERFAEETEEAAAEEVEEDLSDIAGEE